MSGPTPLTEFQTMVARYKRCGWDVRSIDHATSRAFVRAGTGDHHDNPGGPSVTAPSRAPACRKLWVDAQGQVQETNVPC
jgi:hypothetical protein